MLLQRALARACERFPDSIAYRCSDEALTFQDLHRRVAQFAAALVELGVRPGDRVGVLSPPSLWQVVAVHGCLYCGAVFVPLDPRAPAHRLSAILEDAGVTVVYADPGVGAVLLDLAATPAAAIGVAEGAATCVTHAEVLERTERPPANGSEAAPAYLMFTSGSTGRPKGLLHTHASGYAYVERVLETYSIDASDRCANFAPLHFDIATLGYLAAPTAGALTQLFSDAEQLFPTRVAAVVEAQALTLWYSAPYALQQLLKRSDFRDRDMTSLRWVLFGGEVFPPGEVAELMRALPEARFSNVYGPAEVNQCTFFHLETPPSADEIIPLGQPWADTELALLDDHAEVVEGPGSGELLVSTPTMMDGYWRQPELNDRAFYTLGSPPRRFYRTGDRVQRRRDGSYAFLGRMDRQVKIRGYRVEPDEIEAQALRFEAVLECAVVPATTPRGDAYLALFAQTRDSADSGGPADPVQGLRQHLAARLPTYAVPKELHLSTEPLPRNSSDKLDRRVLLQRLTQG
ncbi:MAG: amino acid adenylation domain-containing protein [Pseudomonadota bacterium]